MNGPLDTGGAVLRFLRSVGPGTDAEYYLRQFREGPAERFAAIAVDGASLREGRDAVCLDLRFLAQLGLSPVVVIGLATGDGEGEAAALAETLSRAGVAAAVLAPGHPRAIADAARAGVLPIVPLRDATNATDAGDAEADAPGRLGALLGALQTRKLILLRGEGGLREGGARISVVNVSDELPALEATGRLDAGDLATLRLASALLLAQQQQRLLVSITSPLNLLHELFTVRGAGTLLRTGRLIRRSEGLHDVDRARLLQLLETSFGRPPRPTLLDRDYTHAYVEEDYRGAALLQAHPQWGYLSKFAVTRRAQGEGIGRDLWQAVQRDYPRLLWRSRGDNAINPWYEARCDGRMRSGVWTVYFRGLSPEDLPAAIEHATSRPDDLPQPIG